MNSRHDTFNDELCQVNTHVDCIAQRQAHLSGFVASPSPSLEASEDEDNDGDFNDNADDEDEDANFSGDDEMTA